MKLSIACVGSRKATKRALEWMVEMGAEIARGDYRIVTGNAPGSDQAWAAGGNSVDPKSVMLVLPWKGFERKTIREGNDVLTFTRDVLGLDYDDAIERAERLHPRWEACSNGARLLHGRNVIIARKASLMVGYPGSTGGTKLAFAASRAFDRPVYNIKDEIHRATFEKAVRAHSLEDLLVLGKGFEPSLTGS